MKQKDKDIWNKGVELVGLEVLEKLGRHGLAVADRRSLDEFLEEQRKSNTRIRETAAAAMRAIGIDTYRLELVVVDGKPTIIATAPSGNEKDLAMVAASAIASAWSPPDGWTEMAPSEGRLHETTNVAVCGKPEEGDLLARAERAEQKVKALGDAYRGDLAKLEEARARLGLVSACVDDVWRWQGDGCDHPESLSCPVVMSANKLRAILRRTERAEDMIRTLLASAVPHPVEHPTMTKAWAAAREFLGALEPVGTSSAVETTDDPHLAMMREVTDLLEQADAAEAVPDSAFLTKPDPKILRERAKAILKGE